MAVKLKASRNTMSKSQKKFCRTQKSDLNDILGHTGLKLGKMLSRL